MEAVFFLLISKMDDPEDSIVYAKTAKDPG